MHRDHDRRSESGSPAVYDHVRLTDRDHPDGIYRVVGVREETVTLLRVADADGRRTNTGDLVTVPAGEFDELTPAENPDGNRPLGTVIASNLETGYWAVRVFGRQLAVQPFRAAVALTLVAAGLFGAPIVRLPDVIESGLVIVGCLALAYLGSGRG